MWTSSSCNLSGQQFTEGRIALVSSLPSSDGALLAVLRDEVVEIRYANYFR